MSGLGPAFVWVDGAVLPAAGPHLSVFDRGFQLGDGVFETLRAKAGRPTELAEHVARLRRSADGLMRLNTSENRASSSLDGSNRCAPASISSYGVPRRSSSVKRGRNQSGCS